MKKLIPIFLTAITLAFSACTSTPAETKPAADTTPAKVPVTYPYPIEYSTQFEFADPALGKSVLELWKAYDNNTFDNIKDKFADTVTMIFPEAAMHKTTRDSVIAAAKAARGSYASVVSKVDVVMPLRATDKKEDWVAVWGVEYHTTKANKTDSVAIHELWAFDKNGKINYMQQYASKKIAD